MAASTYLALLASTSYYTSKTDLTIKEPSGLWWYLKAPGEGNHAWRCLLGDAPEAEGCGRVNVIVVREAESCAPLCEHISVDRFWRAESWGGHNGGGSGMVFATLPHWSYCSADETN